jgi:hypothetical protein
LESPSIENTEISDQYGLLSGIARENRRRNK